MSRRIVLTDRKCGEYVSYGHKDKLYKVYMAMCRRCYYEKYKFYHRYGGRGITVCDDWLNSYDSFKNWALSSGYEYKAPKGSCTLDRIDNDGNYEPANCRWVTIKEQLNNSSRNVLVTANGETHNLQQWADILGTTHGTLSSRHRRGWSDDRIINTPIKNHRKEKQI